MFFIFYRVTKGSDKVPDNNYTVKGLTNGKEYEFRVAAVNKAGHGEWAETEQAIQARPPDCMFSQSFIIHILFLLLLNLTNPHI